MVVLSRYLSCVKLLLMMMVGVGWRLEAVALVGNKTVALLLLMKEIFVVFRVAGCVLRKHVDNIGVLGLSTVGLHALLVQNGKSRKLGRWQLYKRGPAATALRCSLLLQLLLVALVRG